MTVDLRAVQAPLRERYKTDPDAARVVTSARSVEHDPADPQHCVVRPIEFPEVTLRSGLHAAAGGSGEVPCSGDILASAVAICEEATIRSVAANMGVPLESVSVEVDIEWDFRGTLGVDRDVPVGAKRIEVRSKVVVAAGVNQERARRILGAAEKHCATLQTLRTGVPVIETSLDLSHAPAS